MPRKNKVESDDKKEDYDGILTPVGKTVKVTLLSRCGDMGVFVDVNGKRYSFNDKNRTLDVEEADLPAFNNREIFKLEDD